MDKNKVKEWLKRDTSVFVISLCQIIIGILLFINPLAFTNGIVIACGAIMLILGVASIVGYFTTEKTLAAAENSLFEGMLLLIIGGFCAFQSKWLVEVVSIASILYGVVLVLLALKSIQSMVNMLRLKDKKWFLELINAVVLLVFAIVIFLNPFDAVVALWIFVGVALIVSALYNSAKAIIITRSQVNGQGEAAANK